MPQHYYLLDTLVLGLLLLVLIVKRFGSQRERRYIRCNVNFFCLCLICDFSYYNPILTAEMSHFHDQKVADFKSMMQHFIQEQIDYHQRVSLTKFA